MSSLIISIVWICFYHTITVTSKLKPVILQVKRPETCVPGRLTPSYLIPPQGSRNRKKLAGVVALIGMAFENAPVPSSVPVLFVVQLIGADRLVVVSQV